VTAAGGTGAFHFLRALEAVSGSGDSHALVHVIRASDRRVHSSRWELYSIVRSFRCAYISVCVVVVRDDPQASPALAFDANDSPLLRIGLNVHLQNIVPADERCRRGRHAGERQVHGNGTNAAHIITRSAGRRQIQWRRINHTSRH
jgi:hypothetical protein